MAVQLDHTIVSARDSLASATFLTEIFGLAPPTSFGPFLVVEVDNGVSLDFLDTAGTIVRQHYAFLIGEPEFEQIFARINERGIAYWADPGKSRLAACRTFTENHAKWDLRSKIRQNFQFYSSFERAFGQSTSENLRSGRIFPKSDRLLGQINHGDGGRGFYFDDPNGHLLEVLTRRYGSSC